MTTTHYAHVNGLDMYYEYMERASRYCYYRALYPAPALHLAPSYHYFRHTGR